MFSYERNGLKILTHFAWHSVLPKQFYCVEYFKKILHMMGKVLCFQQRETK